MACQTTLNNPGWTIREKRNEIDCMPRSVGTPDVSVPAEEKEECMPVSSERSRQLVKIEERMEKLDAIISKWSER